MQEYLRPEYKKSEYVELQDKLYFCRHHQQALSRELDEKEFKCRCMPQTKGYYADLISRDGQMLIASGAIALAMIFLMISCIINPNAGTAVILLVVSYKGAPQAVRSYSLIRSILDNIRIKKGLDEEELDMMARIYDIKIELEKLQQERDVLEKELKLQDRIREIEGNLYREQENTEEDVT